MDHARRDIYVADTGSARGRGVFAARDFAAGEVVEVAPVVVCSGSSRAMPAAVRDLLFCWDELAGMPGRHGLALGYGSLYNHANPANLRYVADAQAHTLRFVAVRAVAAGEELTINYNAKGGDHEADHDTWFKRRGIAVVDV